MRKAALRKRWGGVVAGLVILAALALISCSRPLRDRLGEVEATTVPTAQAQATRRPATAAPTVAAPAVQLPAATPTIAVQPTLTAAPTQPPVPTGQSYVTGSSTGAITSGGELRGYLLHVPPSYQPGTPMPLVINLHGFSSNAAEEEILSEMSAKADEAGFIVVYPEGRGSPQSWAVGPGPAGQQDVQFIRDLVALLQEQLSIDPARIYATGISNGGGMANRLACDMPDVIAAIAPVSGAYLFWQDCSPSRPVPVVAFHGTADQIVPYEGQGRTLPPIRDWAAAWASRNGCSATPTVTFQKGEVTGETWDSCSAEVVLYTIEGRGHSWPGSAMIPALDIATQDIVATEVIWEFFAAH